jgi:transcriptional regulator with XRE-family HTH domain
MAQHKSFDAEAFFSALDAQRRSRGLKWKQVASEAGVNASTLTRMGQGKRPDVDSLAALSTWAGLAAGEFVRGKTQGKAETLTMISTYLRSDPNLTPESVEALDELIKATYERLPKQGDASKRIQD